MVHLRRLYVSAMAFAVVAAARVAELGLDNHTPSSLPESGNAKPRVPAHRLMPSRHPTRMG